MHFSSKGSIEKWCGKAGLIIEQTTEVLHRRAAAYNNLIPACGKKCPCHRYHRSRHAGGLIALIMATPLEELE